MVSLIHCSHGIPFEMRCDRCVEEGIAKVKKDYALRMAKQEEDKKDTRQDAPPIDLSKES